MKLRSELELLGLCLPFIAGSLEVLRADCVSPPSGLIAWWRAENNALDQVGPNHGVLQSGALFGVGRVDQAFSFDGAGASVSVTDATNLHFTTQFTLESWVNPANRANDPLVLSKFNGANYSYELEVLANGGLRANVSGDGTTYDALISSPGLVSTGAWSHVATTFNSGTWKLFVNGVEVASKTSFVTTIFPGTANLLIGRDAGTTHFFSGLIDEPAVYNRALSTNEIAAIFTAGNAGKCPPSCTPAPPGLIHWYRAESDGRDSAGTKNGSLESGVTAGNVGLVGGAFRFNGTNGGVNLGNAPDLDFTPSSSFTIEAWINPFGPTIQQAQYIVALNYQCSPTDQELAMYNSGADAGKVGFFIRDANSVSVNTLSPSLLTTNTFHHVAGVREVIGITKTLKLYVDGVLVATTNDVTTGALAGSGADYIGRRFPCPDASTFNGLIDEVSIYNRALTSNEVAAIFAAGSAGKCGAPTLTIFLTPTNSAVVSWLSPSTGFGLQQNTNHAGSVNWSNVTTINDNGTNKFIIVNPPSGNRFYRLFKP